LNKLLLASATLAALVAAGPAIADNLPLYGWTGCYVGANLGVSFGRSETSVVVPRVPVAVQALRMDGVVGGGQAGCNYQSSAWVMGLEADIQGTSQDGSGPAQVNPRGPPAAGIGGGSAPVGIRNLALDEGLPWFGTFRGRFGFTPTDRSLVYATGGLAYGEVDTGNTLGVGPASIVNNFSNARLGWTVGAGVEAALWGNWTGKLEYLYVDLGSFSNTFAGPVFFTPITVNSHVTDNIVRAGLNWRFY